MMSYRWLLLWVLPSALGAPAGLDWNSIPPAGEPSPPAISTTTSVVSPTLLSQSNFTTILTIPTITATTTATSTSVDSFVPIPAPTLPPNPLGYPATDPQHPPDVSSDPQIVPDFSPAWAAAYKKAKKLISEYTIEEKVNITTGVGWAQGLCVGNIPPNKNFPGLCLQDSPLGVRLTDHVTAFPAGIQAASTWNRALIRARGLAMGEEFRGKGVNIALGPMMNLGRVAQGGRNWEGFGADPFLAGESAYETILGLQQAGVQATAKHFIGNEQEHFRTQESSIIDDRTIHELYAHPFLRSVMAGVASVMCSYNLVNGTYACENDKLLNDILKREFGFQGYVQSDWSATMSTLSATKGLDMTMPGDITFNSGDSYFGGNLTAYVKEGHISEERLDDMATRIIAAWYYLKQDIAYPKTNFDTFHPTDDVHNLHINVQSTHFTTVREIATKGTVLLKNERGALPLNNPQCIAVIGSDAGPGKNGPNAFPDRGGDDGILAMGWGSGTVNFPYLVTPLDALKDRALLDGTIVTSYLDDWDVKEAARAAVGQDTALVFINSDSGEDYITVDGNEGDRNNMTAWHNGDNLVKAVAAANRNTIVIVNSVGPLILEPWIEHPNVTAVVWAGIQGQEAGNSIVDILYGDYNPSGKLPYTIAKNPADYPAQVITQRPSNSVVDIPYTEGLFIDYRHFDAVNIEPRFEFGFGLSYTEFEYSDLAIFAVPSQDSAEQDLISRWQNGKASPIAPGSSAALWLHEPAFKVTFNVENIGSVCGTEIPQLYIHHPSNAGEPPSILKGFSNVEIDPGQTEQVSITLSRYDLSIWDVVAQGWRKPTGTIEFSVGASSRDLKLKGVIPV
ncbi:glycoside hydrolase superfamily [Scleroderma yunnanense]